MESLVEYSRYCPICGNTLKKFAANGLGRKDCKCPKCNSLERHRLAWIFFKRQTNLLDGKPKKVLHVAAERCFRKRLQRRVGTGYLTADLSRNAMVKMDICDIQYPDKTFDVIICSHVLEHIPDDKLAIGELYRVLKKSGWAMLNVPTPNKVETFEDPTIVDPEERKKVYGHPDHKRNYGIKDYGNRLVEAGFEVTTFDPNDLVGKKKQLLMGLGKAGKVFYCKK